MGIWKLAVSATSVLAAVGLTAGTVYIAGVDTNQIALTSDARLTRSPAVAVASAAISAPAPDETQTFYGYYGDLNAAGTKTNVSKETYKLRFSRFSSEVAGDISGPVPYQGGTVQRTWKVRGFSRDRELVLNILAVESPSDPKPPTGIGTYYLAKGGEDYTGTAIYLDCVHKYVQCPYALADEDISSEQAKVRWPELFKRECVKIDLTPGIQAPSQTC
jgi:hypothetical protein